MLNSGHDLSSTAICTATIVSAAAFHDSVRNGKRWDHNAQVTRIKHSFLCQRIKLPKLVRKNFSIYPLLSLTPCRASTRNVLTGSLPAISLPTCAGKRFLILGSASCLRCFQQLSNRNVATQQCT